MNVKAQWIAGLALALAAAAAVVGAAQATRPDDRPGLHGAAPSDALRKVVDAKLASAPPGSSGFQWRDAAVGAGATIGLLALGGILLIGIRRRTHVALP